MPGNAVEFSRYQVVRHGAVWAGGVIGAVFMTPRPETPVAYESGLPLWAHELEKYQDETYTTCIKPEGVVVYADGLPVDLIPFDALHRTQNYYRYVVFDNGYLRPDRADEYERKIRLALSAAQARRKPDRLDNLYYTWVDPETYAGQKLILVPVGHKPDDYRVYTPEGKLIRSFTHMPLSTAYWEPGPIPPSNSIRGH